MASICSTSCLAPALSEFTPSIPTELSRNWEILKGFRRLRASTVLQPCNLKRRFARVDTLYSPRGRREISLRPCSGCSEVDSNADPVKKFLTRARGAFEPKLNP